MKSAIRGKVITLFAIPVFAIIHIWVAAWFVESFNKSDWKLAPTIFSSGIVHVMEIAAFIFTVFSCSEEKFDNFWEKVDPWREPDFTRSSYPSKSDAAK